MQRLLISDSNVIIDFEEGGVIEALFKLPYQFAVPDALFVEELKEQHEYVIGLGLQVMELTSESILCVLELNAKYQNPSLYDIMALVLAKQMTCTLVTGDKRLRTAADRELVDKKGTIWLLTELLDHCVLSIEEVDLAVSLMKGSGSRLPWDVVEKELERYR